MPLSVFLPKKVVKLNSETSALLKKFEEALKNIKPDEKNVMATAGAGSASPSGATTPKDSRDLSAGQSTMRAGLTPKLVSCFESILDKSLGAKERPLGTIDVALDPPASILRDAYIDYLNKIIKAVGIGAEQTEQPEISDPFVLVREILIRFVTVALCTDMDASRDGDAVIKALQIFIMSINKDNPEKNILKDKSWHGFGNSSSAFNIHFVTEHVVWVACFKEMVSITKFIHAPSHTISSALNHLRKIKITILRFLVANFEPNTKSENLSENWIRQTLEDCENEVLKKYSDAKFTATALVAADYKEEVDRPKRLIRCLETHWNQQNKELQRRFLNIKNLYLFLGKTNFVIDIVSEYDFMVSTTAWVSIMTGAIKVDVLAEIIKIHGMQCSQLLKLTPEDPIFKTEAGKAIISDDTILSGEIDIAMTSIARNLWRLQDHRVISKLTHLVSGSMNKLGHLQSKIPEILGLGAELKLTDPKLQPTLHAFDNKNTSPVLRLEAPGASTAIVHKTAAPKMEDPRDTMIGELMKQNDRLRKATDTKHLDAIESERTKLQKQNEKLLAQVAALEKVARLKTIAVPSGMTAAGAGRAMAGATDAASTLSPTAAAALGGEAKRTPSAGTFTRAATSPGNGGETLPHSMLFAQPHSAAAASNSSSAAAAGADALSSPTQTTTTSSSPTLSEAEIDAMLQDLASPAASNSH